MQTRSMTRKGLSRAASLPVEVRGQPAPSSSLVDVVSSDSATVEHCDDGAVVMFDGQPDNERPTLAQQQLLSIVHAQACAHAMTQRNTEQRIHQAFFDTEARLHATAQSLVQAHAKEQALETRRDLGEAIQRALIDAHSQAHQQAMQAAHERLARFTSEIEEKIQSQLAGAVNEVSTKGVAYIEQTAADKLAILKIDMQASVESIAKTARLHSSGVAQLEDGSATELSLQLEAFRAQLPQQLADCKKRSYDGAVSTACAQAERIMNEAEGRLAGQIESRLIAAESQVEETVSAAVIRAETHCNVVEKRAKESIERALKELRASRIERTEICVNRAFDGRVEAKIDELLRTKVDQYLAAYTQGHLKSVVEALAQETMSSWIERHLDSKMKAAVDSMIAPSGQPRVAATVTDPLNEQIQLRIQEIAKDAAMKHLQQLGDTTPSSRVESIANETTMRTLTREFEIDIRPRVKALVEQETSKMGWRLDQLVRDVVSSHIRPVNVAHPGPTQPKGHVGGLAGTSYKEDLAPSEDEMIRIRQALARAYPSKSTTNQDDGDDLESTTSFLLNPRAILAAREQRARGQNHTKAPAQPPKTLTSLRADELREFLSRYQQYRRDGGQDAWTTLCDPALLSYVRSCEGRKGASDHDILRHLETKAAQGTPNVALIEQKLGEVKIDPQASSSLEKVESILLGVEKVLFDLELKSSGETKSVTVPLTTYIEIVMEKLPFRLRALVDRRVKFSPPMQSKREFRTLLFDEATSFQWPSSREMHFNR